MGTIIALGVGFISKRLYGWGSWWGQITREAVKFARKETAQKQYRDILSYRLDGNLLTFYVTRKVLFILCRCTLLIVTIGFMTVLVANSPEHVGFDAIVERDPTGLIVIFIITTAMYFSAITGAMSELWKTASSYRNFAEFKAKVREQLSVEEMTEIEKSLRTLILKKV